ncbi:MAG: hypothetical protein MUE97_02985 [Phycisphaerales bacterium]|jgi:hypothetical protein|nr:hypothetical protein [Phycisphaerales bacterium]
MSLQEFPSASSDDPRGSQPRPASQAAASQPQAEVASSNIDASGLCPKSRAAIDSLIDAAMDEQRVAPEHRPRCAKIQALLSSLRACDHGVCPEKIAAKTLARIKHAGPLMQDQAVTAELCEDDGEALESLVSEGYSPSRVPSVLRPRAERLALLMDNLERPISQDRVDAAAAREALISRTLAAVQAEVDSGRSRMRIHEASMRDSGERLGRQWRLIDVVGVAAMVAVGGAMLWPTVASMRQRAMEVAGASRMASLGGAMGQYSTDFRGSAPLASASLAGSIWWNIGKPEQSNTANLFTLRRTGYATLEQLTSPGNAHARGVQLGADAWDWQNLEQVSYSFQNQFCRQRARMHEVKPTFVILADKSPVALRAWRGERVVYFNENSPNFGGRGQNVLHVDGSSRWLTTPFTASGDNLWLPASIEKVVRCAERLARGEKHCDPLQGIEQPSAKDDVFLCP